MGISIRNAKVEELARELADRRGTNMTEAIEHALRKTLDETPAKRPLREVLEELAAEARSMMGPNPRAVSKKELDDLWGQ